MANAASVYNLKHVQVAEPDETPTWIDLPYAQTLDPTIDQADEDVFADSKVAFTAYGAPVGTASVEWARGETVTLALLAGLTATSSGTTPATIDRLEYLADTMPPGLHWSAWAENVDASVTGAGMRVTFPNGKAKVPTFNLGQQAAMSFSADMKFSGNAAGVMMIIEFLETAPTFTSEVMPVNLVAPV